MESYENLTGIINALWKRRKLIIGITILTTFASAGLSLLLDDYFEAETIFYAASPDLAKPSPMGISESKMDYYGESEDIDRLLSLAQSSELNGKIIAHFSLYDHYEIDPESSFADYKVQKKLAKAFTIEKTKYDALRLSIEDTNPILSRDMTNFARDNINAKAQQLIKDSQAKLITTFESNIKRKTEKILESNNILDSLRNHYEIFDTKSQGQIIAQIMSTTKSNLVNVRSRMKSYQGINRDSVAKLKIQLDAYQSQMNSISNQAKSYNSGLSKIVSLEKQLTEASDQLGIDKERYKLLKAAYENDFSAIHVVEFAKKPKRKSRPKRSILVIAACAASFIFSSLAAIIFAFYKKVNWKDVLSDD